MFFIFGTISSRIEFIGMNIATITKGFNERDGIWFSHYTDRVISYPPNDNLIWSEVEKKSYWFIQRNKIIGLLAQRFCSIKELIDIGGGNGFVSQALDDAGFDVYMIEPGITGILKAKERGLKNLVNASFDELQLTPDSLPNAGLFDVLEHIKDDIGMLKSLHLALQPSGKIVITVPAYRFLWSQADITAGHFRRYSSKSILKILEETGFTIVFKSYFFSFLTPMIFFFRTIPYHLSRKTSSPLLSRNREHIAGSGITSTLLNLCCRNEMRIIEKGRKIRVGSSIIIIAEK
jgi:2-polyprenyl-3-methyl-5-hydroxy-6-metoxy-1,4-benzoquinol methylase